DIMYKNQQITVANIYNDEFSKEINYLKSNHLFIDNNNELQFFHQTFYDYTFSKQFVENKLSLPKYILENDQSLYIRSVTKMVLDYYRDYNNDEYCKTVTKLVKPSKYRFHIKALVITSLGNIKNPTKREKSIALNLLLKNFDYARVFLNSVYSKGWLNYFLKDGLPLKYFNYSKNWKHNLYDKLLSKKIIDSESYKQYNYISQKDLRLSLIFRLFYNNKENCLDEILEY